jgi:hypothetical protein
MPNVLRWLVHAGLPPLAIVLMGTGSLATIYSTLTTPSKGLRTAAAAKMILALLVVALAALVAAEYWSNRSWDIADGPPRLL